MSSRGLAVRTCLERNSNAPVPATTARMRLTYRHQRQERYSVRTPPRQQANPGAGAGDRTEDPERFGALLRVGERGGQEGKRGGSEECGEDALNRARGDEGVEALGGTAQSGGNGKADEADDQRSLAAEEVRQPAAEQQQAAEAERVGGHHPLAVAVREAQRLLGRGQSDVDDRGVEDDHQLGDAQDGEYQPAPVVIRRVRIGHSSHRR